MLAANLRQVLKLTSNLITAFHSILLARSPLLRLVKTHSCLPRRTADLAKTFAANHRWNPTQAKIRFQINHCTISPQTRDPSISSDDQSLSIHNIALPSPLRIQRANSLASQHIESASKIIPSPPVFINAPNVSNTTYISIIHTYTYIKIYHKPFWFIHFIFISYPFCKISLLNAKVLFLLNQIYVLIS